MNPLMSGLSVGLLYYMVHLSVARDSTSASVVEHLPSSVHILHRNPDGVVQLDTISLTITIY